MLIGLLDAGTLARCFRAAQRREWSWGVHGEDHGLLGHVGRCTVLGGKLERWFEGFFPSQFASALYKGAN